jgi:hypothetical protein
MAPLDLHEKEDLYRGFGSPLPDIEDARFYRGRRGGRVPPGKKVLRSYLRGRARTLGKSSTPAAHLIDIMQLADGCIHQVSKLHYPEDCKSANRVEPCQDRCGICPLRACGV